MTFTSGGWPVGKDMAKVAATTTAMHFGAGRKQSVILFGTNRIRKGLPKAGPPRTTVKFGI